MLFSRRPREIPSVTEALAGRDEPMTVDDAHRVLDTSLTGPWPDGTEVLHVAMGCFWGAERIFWQIPGVHVTAVGYMGGSTFNPTYEEVCSGRTGHTEAVRVVYDPDRVDVETLLRAFWENHDPTQGMRQGNDVGTQYRSAIYTTTPDQLAAAERSRQAYQADLSAAGFGTITTEIADADDVGPFFLAEDGHQAYLDRYPNGYCNHGFCQVAYAGASAEG